MNLKCLKLAAPLTAVFALAACASDVHHHHHSHGGYNPHAPADVDVPRSTESFKCQNGFTVKVERQRTNRIAVEYGLQDDRNHAVLESAVSGSGERYVSRDKKTEWHQKGGTAFLSFTDPYGNVTETSCRR